MTSEGQEEAVQATEAKEANTVGLNVGGLGPPAEARQEEANVAMEAGPTGGQPQPKEDMHVALPEGQFYVEGLEGDTATCGQVHQPEAVANSTESPQGMTMADAAGMNGMSGPVDAPQVPCNEDELSEARQQ